MSDPVLVADLTTVASMRPAAAIAVPAVGAIVVLLTSSSKRREATAIIATLVTFAIALAAGTELLAGRVHVFDPGPFASSIGFSLQADPLGLLFGVLVSGLYVVLVPAVHDHLRRRDTRSVRRASSCLLATLAATMGIAFAGNLLVLFVFFELLTVVSYPLAVHKETPAARQGGYVYLAYAFASGVVVLGGIRVVYWLSGTVAFVSSGIPELATAAATEPGMVRIAFGLLFVGFGVKAALLPFHAWVLRTRAAPTPIFGLVFAVISLKAGAFGVSRTVLETLGPETVDAIGVADPAIGLAAVTILGANLLALRRSAIGARVTYLTIAGGTTVVLGVIVATPAAIVGSLVHFVTHAVATLTLFLVVSVLGSEDARAVDLNGASERLPLPTVAFALGAASLIGVPFLAGFVGSWSLLIGTVSAGRPIVVAVLLVSGVFHVVALWPLVVAAFIDVPDRIDPAVALDRGRPEEPRTEEPATTDGGEHTTIASERRRSGLSSRQLWAFVATTGFLVGFGLIPDRLFFLEAARIVAESAVGVIR